MKGIRDLKRSSESNMNTERMVDNNNPISKMDQEIIQNYKIKVFKMEEEMRNVKDDYESLKRNFDALTLKGKMDVERIKQLEEELSILVLNSKLNSNQPVEKKQDDYYNEKLDKLEQKYIDKIKLLSDKMIENDGLFNRKIAKLIENEKVTKSQIAKNEEKYNSLVKSKEVVDNEFSLTKLKLKNCIEENEKNLSTTRKNYEALLNSNLEKNSKHYEKIISEKDEEINNLRNATKSLLDKNKITINKTMTIDNQIDKLKKENEIYSKLVDEYKEKLSKKDLTIFEIRTELDEKDEKFKKILNQLEENLKKITVDKNLLEIEKCQLIEKLDNMNLINNNLLSKFNEIEKRNKFLEQQNCSKKDPINLNEFQKQLLNLVITILESLDASIIKQHEEIFKKFKLSEDRIEKITSNINKFSSQKNSINLKMNYEEEILFLKNQIEVQNEKFKSDMKSMNNNLAIQNNIINQKKATITDLEKIVLKMQLENESYVNLISSSNKKLIKFKEDQDYKNSELNKKLELYIKEIETVTKEKDEILKKYELDKERIKGITEIKSVHGQIKGVVGKVQ